jgi:hypothetical protein
MNLEFENVNYVDDGGELAAEMVLTGAEIVGLHDTGRLHVGNARPDHDLVPLKSGKLKYRKTAQRIKDWTDALLRNEAVIGNLTVNLNPDEARFEIDEENHRLIVLSGDFDQGVDSASRTRAIIAAAKNPLQTFRLDTRFAVRVWFVDDGTERRLFHVYNQVGEKVNDTVAKFQYQSTAHQRIARMLMAQSPHLGIDNIEVQSNTVSATSFKLAAFNTLSQAVEGFWSNDPLTEADEKADADYLVRFWDELAQQRPEFGRLSTADRQAHRGKSVAGAAVSIHGVVALADAMKSYGVPLSELAKLKSTVNVAEAGKPDKTVDYFDYDNPEWTERGVLVMATSKSGELRKTLRMSFQTRKAMGDALIAKLGL